MKKLLILSLMFFMIACSVKTSVVKLADSTRTPVAVEWVKTYQTEDDVPGNFEKIAVVTARGSAVYNTKKALLLKLREKAGLLGANAIILSGGRDKSLAGKALSMYLTAGLLGKKEFSAIAIYIYPKKK